MKLLQDPHMQWLFGGMLGLLVLASVVGAVLSRVARSEKGKATVANVNARIRAWWVMCVVFAIALLAGGLGIVPRVR